jgi:hypothetical protein
MNINTIQNILEILIISLGGLMIFSFLLGGLKFILRIFFIIAILLAIYFYLGMNKQSGPLFHTSTPVLIDPMGEAQKAEARLVNSIIISKIKDKIKESQSAQPAE